MSKVDRLAFRTLSDETVIVDDRTFLLFIDETGGETLNDPDYPIFGFGGVGLPAQLYRTNIVTPWLHLKGKEFGGAGKPMHASDLRNPTSGQLEALNTFFERCCFCRIAAVLSDKTALAEPVDMHNLVVACFYKELCAVLAHTDFEDIIMVFEHSERGTVQTIDYFSRYSVTAKALDASALPVKCRKYVMKKTELEPGLEVADFIAHTAGTSVRSRLENANKTGLERRDFKAVFKSSNTKLSSFFEITKAEVTADGTGGFSTDG